MLAAINIELIRIAIMTGLLAAISFFAYLTVSIWRK